MSGRKTSGTCRPSLGAQVFALFSQGAAKRRSAKGVQSLFFRFRDSFGHFLVTSPDASVAFFVTFLPSSFCRTPFAAGSFPSFPRENRSSEKMSGKMPGSPRRPSEKNIRDHPLA